MRWLALGAVTLLASVLGLAALLGDGQAESAELKISAEVLAQTAGGGEASFVVYLDDQADVGAAHQMKDQDARGRYVYETLKQHAARTQAPVRAALDAAGAQYRSFWAANVIFTEGDRELVNTLAARSDVRAIESNAASEWVDEDDTPDAPDETDAVHITTPGVNNVQAPALWSLGFDGTGIVVANQDTGMRWTHVALKPRYRGWDGANADHNYNWWDSIHAQLPGSGANNVCGRNTVAPCDDNGHGTHTTGTAVGVDGGTSGTQQNQVGVAPGAKWIGCRNMDAGNGRPYTYAECFQFFIAPTDLNGQNADPTKRPHVMNNSWGCPPSEECAANTLKTIVENAEAAGIFVVASAGNSGPSCNTVQDPPAIYDAAFSVGAINGSTNAVASFSSRGPVTVDGSNRPKPELVAPGQSVRSATRSSDTAYSSSSGTSMAGPHVVGVVALLWSARPNLVRDIPRTKQLLMETANPNVTVPNNAAGCGGTASIPNNHFGHGRIDAMAAYAADVARDQTITFPELEDRLFGAPDFDPGATASSGLPVTYTTAGSCAVAGGLVHITDVGTCTVTASQPGSDDFYPAADVSRSFAITWPFAGFASPIAAGTNTVQAGRNVPVKFSLGSDAGLDVLAVGSPLSTPVACDTGAAAGEGAPTQIPGASGLSYEEGEYHYNWKTEKGWAGTCRQLVVTLRDGTSHSALFAFKG